MHFLLKTITSITLMLFMTSNLYATVIYKWVDSEGRTHFTDNEANIPLKQNNYEKRKLKDTAPPKEKIKPDVANIALGKKIWESTCSQCHFIGPNYENSQLRKLPQDLLNPDISLEDMTKKLAFSLDLRAVDMNDIKLSDTETQAVAKYILQRITAQ
ncbi:DUF4124 domain-containing protein [Ghiorsea bivora]|uniref:DUF4124 domain-containing protein n=1 Tax=Ghiorsea bivora TaxID=1485545 RepID=UPI0005702089|nr:DUF4124 domain-containing protein [Ghiorsea bivora]